MTNADNKHVETKENTISVRVEVLDKEVRKNIEQHQALTKTRAKVKDVKMPYRLMNMFLHGLGIFSTACVIYKSQDFKMTMFCLGLWAVSFGISWANMQMKMSPFIKCDDDTEIELV